MEHRSSIRAEGGSLDSKAYKPKNSNTQGSTPLTLATGHWGSDHDWSASSLGIWSN